MILRKLLSNFLKWYFQGKNSQSNPLLFLLLPDFFALAEVTTYQLKEKFG